MADKPTKAELAKLPGGADFDVDNATTEDFDKHMAILNRRKQVAEAQYVAPAAPQGAPAPVQQAATFSPPSVELVGKHDSVTGLVQQLPPALWDKLSDEDKERFTPVTEQPEKLPIE